jgi:transposase
MPHLQGIDRNQTLQFPPRLDDYISAENPVRFLDVFVDQLDLQGMGFSHVETAAEGRPPYHPGDLLKLYLYGYLNRVRSSRCLERESQRNVEVMWLLKGLTPDHKTIADFRKVHPQALKQVFREFIELCKALELFGGEIVAIDGSKFLAVNSAQRNYSEKKLEKALKEIDEKLQRYLQVLDANDAAIPVPSDLTPEQYHQKIEVLKERQAKYQQIQTQLVESGETQISLTDSDSRAMKMGQGTDVAYNVQIAVDGKYKLIAVAEVTNQVTDQAQLSPMATQAKATLEVEALTVLADRGYYDGEEVKQCLESGITPNIAKPITSVNQKRGLYTKQDFRYDPERDVYHCPAGQELEFRFDAVELGRHIRYYRTAACKNCPLKDKCTTNRDGRRITRWVDEHLLEEMAQRLKVHPDYRIERSSLVEHPFGTLKRGMNQGYFLLKGLEKVRGEFSLSALAYNLKRVFNIVGVEKLISALTMEAIA